MIANIIQGLMGFAYLLMFPFLGAQTAGVPQDDAAVWKSLQSPAMDPGKSASVENLEIIRDRMRITLKSGTIQFAQPVNDIVFAAVFHGAGRLQADPPNPIEEQQLRLFTRQGKLDMTFTDATFSFTDGLFEEVARQVKWTPGASGDDLYRKRQQEREDLGQSVLPRLLQSILSSEQKRTAFFLADVKTGEKGWVEVCDDTMDEEEIWVGRWVEVGGGARNFDGWMSFPAAGRTSTDAWKDPEAKSDFVIRAYKIDTTVTADAQLRAEARVTLEPRLAGQRVLVFDLDSNLRVESVIDEQGKPLGFYQAREDKDRSQSYGDYLAVVLPAPFPAGQSQTLVFRYGGKRVIRKAGTGNYFCASSGWYPGRPNGSADRADFDLTFHHPKKLVLVATGEKTSESIEGNSTTTKWKSETNLAVAGFAYGDYKVYNDKAGSIDIDVYANREPDDVLKQVRMAFESGDAQGAVGTLSPSMMAKTMGMEIANTLRVFENYYGPYPYKRLAVTSLPVSYSYGQGWPGLIYLWSASFLDSTQRNAIGLTNQIELTDSFRAHESSHEWWGHRVGWKSYHDQWLSEGFAEFSAILYVQYRRNWKEALTQLRKEKEHLRLKDTKGHTLDSLGPIWLGRRIASSETDGSSYQNLVYSKGAYVLYMLRHMLRDPDSRDPDHFFKEMMRDYCKTFDNKPASTEDFKAIVEKHILQNMDLDDTHKVDWFFKQYVYGTGMPQYEFSYKAMPTSDGKINLSVKIVRSGVPDDWKDAIPMYGHQGNNTTTLGSIRVVKPVTAFEAVLPGGFDRFSINDFEELLAEVRQ